MTQKALLETSQKSALIEIKTFSSSGRHFKRDGEDTSQTGETYFSTNNNQQKILCQEELGKIYK